MDPTTKAVIETIGNADYFVTVTIGPNRIGKSVVEASDETNGEKFIVRADELYSAVIELAQQVGIELEDG